MLKRKLLLVGIVLFYCPVIFAQTILDIDSNHYKTVNLGSQVWFAENLRVTRLNDGTPISLVTDSTECDSLLTIGFCWYNNNDSAHKIPYGALYNWHSVNSGKLCPKGWHVPTSLEWDTLVSFLGGNFQAGGILKEIGTTHWKSPNTGATNESGFTALPAGIRISGKKFSHFGCSTYFWTATEFNKEKALSKVLIYYNNTIYTDKNYLNSGFSVRCVKD